MTEESAFESHPAFAELSLRAGVLTAEVSGRNSTATAFVFSDVCSTSAPSGLLPRMCIFVSGVLVFFVGDDEF